MPHTGLMIHRLLNHPHRIQDQHSEEETTRAYSKSLDLYQHLSHDRSN